MQRRRILVSTFLAVALTATATTSLAANNGGFKTGRPSMLTAVKAGVQITPLLTVGDVFGDNGFRFESIPDGISLRTRGNGRVDVYVNHETSKVPFPFNSATPTAANGESDFDNSQVSAADPEQELSRRARRLLRNPEQRRLPAVLLQLPRDQQGGVRPRDPVHERGVPGLRVPAGGLVAAPDRRPGRGGERRRARARRQEQAVPRHLRDGPAQPREQRRRSRGSTNWSCSPATTRSRAAR